MNEHIVASNIPVREKEEALSLLSEIHKSPNITQREISLRLKISLGKANYLINELMKRGAIKVKNFSSKPGKMGKIKYLLTKKGFREKVLLMYYFLKRKEQEYQHLKEEWSKWESVHKKLIQR